MHFGYRRLMLKQLNKTVKANEGGALVQKSLVSSDGEWKQSILKDHRFPSNRISIILKIRKRYYDRSGHFLFSRYFFETYIFVRSLLYFVATFQHIIERGGLSKDMPPKVIQIHEVSCLHAIND